MKKITNTLHHSSAIYEACNKRMSKTVYRITELQETISCEQVIIF